MMQEIHTTEMHTGGEPLRIVTSGYPEIKGNTLLEKRRYAKKHLDNYRMKLMLEPRGHSDMYGAIVVSPDHPDADLAVLFIHNEGYSTMCGHGVIALGRYIVDNGLNKSKHVPIDNSQTTMKVPVNIQCPCGLVTALVDVDNGKSGSVSFISVPGFTLCTNFTVKTPSFGEILIDVAYGGAFYAFVDVGKLAIDFKTTSVTSLIAAADEISTSVRSSGLEIKYPGDVDNDISFLYGTILVDGNDQFPDEKTFKNLCVFADKEVDRSPCGSGVTAHVIIQHAKGIIKQGQVRKFENAKTGSVFTGEVVEEKYSSTGHNMVRVRVVGKAHYTGEAKFTFEIGDPFIDGFRLQ